MLQNKLQVDKRKVTMTAITKSLFAQLNDKRFYFSYGVISLPIGHPALKKLRQYIKDLGKKFK